MTLHTNTMKAVEAYLKTQAEPVLERDIGAALNIDLTTIGIAVKRLQKLGAIRCEQRMFGPHRHGEKQGLRAAWTLAR